jgi:glycosyltransferase involved in cell wall biosynthesis
MALVSVLLPVYNVEKFIEESVFSILNQTYKNIELIVVDDCSTDNTYKIIQELKKQDSRIKLYKNSKNSKIVKTLNIAFQHSRGEYICRMDGDDISDHDRIERKLGFLKENPDVSLVGCSVKSIDENGKLLNRKKMPSNQNIINKTLKFATPVFHIWLAKRDVYEKLNGYRNIPYVEDYDFLLRMTSMGFKYTNLDDYFGYSIRLRHGNTISHAGIIQRKAHRYCYNLYLRRTSGLDDNFSMQEFNEYVSSKPIEYKLFSLSNNMLQRAILIENRYNLKKYLYILLSYLGSKEQRNYINGKLAVIFYSEFLGGD